MPDAKAPGRHGRYLRIAVILSFVLGIPVALAIARSNSGTPANKFGQGRTLRSTTTSDATTPDTISTPKLPTGVQTVRIQAGPAVAALDHALSKTIDAGNYDMTFSFGPASDPTATATGSGLANLDPQALSVNVSPRCIGRVTVRIGGEYAWLIIGGTSDPAGPPSSAGRPWPTYGLIQFQGLVGTCFGSEMRALATIEMASPEGMLALSQQAIAVAKPVGTVKVDGEPATEYEVTLNPAGLLQQAGSTPTENEVLTAALEEIGSSPMTAKVDVDAAGYIVRLEIAVAYSDGFTATHTVTLSNFGDAGTVQLPPVTNPVRSTSTIPPSPWPWRPGCGAISCKATGGPPTPAGTFARPTSECLKNVARAYCELITATKATFEIPRSVPSGGAVVLGPPVGGSYSVYAYLRPAQRATGDLGPRAAAVAALALDNAPGLEVTNVLFAAVTLPGEVPPLTMTGQVRSASWTGAQVIDRPAWVVTVTSPHPVNMVSGCMVSPKTAQPRCAPPQYVSHDVLILDPTTGAMLGGFFM